LEGIGTTDLLWAARGDEGEGGRRPSPLQRRVQLATGRL